MANTDLKRVNNHYKYKGPIRFKIVVTFLFVCKNSDKNLVDPHAPYSIIVCLQAIIMIVIVSVGVISCVSDSFMTDAFSMLGEF